MSIFHERPPFPSKIICLGFFFDDHFIYSMIFTNVIDNFILYGVKVAAWYGKKYFLHLTLLDKSSYMYNVADRTRLFAFACIRLVISSAFLINQIFPTRKRDVRALSRSRCQHFTSVPFSFFLVIFDLVFRFFISALSRSGGRIDDNSFSSSRSYAQASLAT